MHSDKKFFVFSPILTKLGEITVLMSTAISLSLVKIGLKTKNFYHYAKFCRDPFLNFNYSSPSMRSNQGLAVFMHRCKIGFIYGGIFETTMNTRMTFAFSFIVSNFYPIFTILTNLYPSSFLYFLNRYKKKTKLDFRFFSWSELSYRAHPKCVSGKK